jgi:hypothetical protein
MESKRNNVKKFYMERLRKKILFTIFCVFVAIYMSGQYYLSNADISIEIRLSYKNDTVMVDEKIINKRNYPLYLPLSPYSYNVSCDELLIPLYQVFVEQVDYLIKIYPHDTIMSISYGIRYCKTPAEKISKLKIIADYLNLYKYDRKTRKKILIMPVLVNNDTVYDCPSYRSICDHLKLQVPLCNEIDSADFKSDKIDSLNEE